MRVDHWDKQGQYALWSHSPYLIAESKSSQYWAKLGGFRNHMRIKTDRSLFLPESSPASMIDDNIS